MVDLLHPGSNLLLGSLTLAEQRRLFPQLEMVVLKPGTVLCEPFEPVRYAYFPVDCIISVLCETQDGDSAEFKVVGNEGMFGTILLLGGITSPRRAIVQCGGHAYRLKAQVLQAEFNRYGDMHNLFLRYIQVVFMQTSQMAVCNRHHTVEQQLCRWLLFYLDRSRTDSVYITHQRIADMLGVRREGVTLAARKLQQLGVISYQRGAIAVRERRQLERLSCECYRVVKAEADRLASHNRLAVKMA